jgi:hypothetical protein
MVSGIIFAGTAILWFLIALNVVPRYDRVQFQDKKSYFFPIWCVIGYLFWAYFSTIAEHVRAMEMHPLSIL